MPELVYLYAEDVDVDALLVSREMARHPDSRLLRVNDGQEAIDYLLGTTRYEDRKRFPLPNIILLDVKMPRMNGFDFLQWRRAEAPPDLRVIPVIMFSSSNIQDDVWRAYQLGANRYMVKAGDLDTLGKQLAAMCENWGKYTELAQRNARPRWFPPEL
jgi:CheY-like chemotaxis protein